MTFKNLNLIESVLEILGQEGYAPPIPIQEQSTPTLLQGKDLLGRARASTDKTAAFSIPILQKLYKTGHRKRIKALMLTPTRELAIQIGRSLEAYGHYIGLKHAVIFSGVGQRPQTDALWGGIQVLVVTPSRLLGLMSQGFVSLNSLDFFVLGEADRMLDMGFIHDIKRILRLLPIKRQTLFFLATMPLEIETLANSMLIKPEKVEVAPASSTVDIISQQVYLIEKKEKKDLLIHLLKDASIGLVLIFIRTKYGADKLARILTKAGIDAGAIRGNKTQNARQRALTSFKNHTLRALTATDIATRGIDIDQLSYMINYELPNISETYMHRIGRTGRAGHEGVAISFCESEELPYLKDIQKLIGENIPVMKEYPSVTVEGAKVQEEKQGEIKVKAEANKIYRGSRANDGFWRRKEQRPNQSSSNKQEERE